MQSRGEFFRQAVEFYLRLTREPHLGKPMEALAYRRLGFARMVGMGDPRAEGDFRRSLALYEALLASSPDDPELRDAIGDVQMNLGILAMSSRGMGVAVPSFRQATSIDEGLASDFPDDPERLEQLTDHRIKVASWMEMDGMGDQAEQEWGRLLAFYERMAAGTAGSPGRARGAAAAYLRLARQLGELGRRRDQRDALRRGLALEPEDPALLNDLARSLVLRSDATSSESAEAIELARRAVEANPGEHVYRTTLGLAHLRASQWPLAAEALEKSMKMQTRGVNPSDRLLMAMVYWRRGEKASALEWYIRSLEELSRNPQSDPDLLAFRDEAELLLGRAPAGTHPKRRGARSGSRESASEAP